MGVLVNGITKILWGVGGKTGVWHRRRKDTNGSTGEWNNTNIIWGQEGRQGCGTGGGKIQMGVLVKGITQRDKRCSDRNQRNKVGDGQKRRQECGTERGNIKVGVLVIGSKRNKLGDGQKRRQEYGTERGDIKVGVLVMGIKGTKREKDNREGRNVAQEEGTLRWEF